MEKKLWNTQYYLEERCGKQVVIPAIICGFVICQYHFCFELSLSTPLIIWREKKSEIIFRHAEPREGIRKGGRGKSLAHEDTAGVWHLHHRLVSPLLQWWLLLGADQDRQDRERNNCEGLVQPAAHQHSPSPVQRLLSGQGKNLHPQILSDFHLRDLPDFLFHAFDFDTN